MFANSLRRTALGMYFIAKGRNGLGAVKNGGLCVQLNSEKKGFGTPDSSVPLT